MADAFGMGTAYANGNNYLQAQVSTAVPGSTAAPGVGCMACQPLIYACKLIIAFSYGVQMAA